MGYFDMSKFYKVLVDEFAKMNSCDKDHVGDTLLYLGDDSDTTNIEFEKIWYYLQCKHGNKRYKNLYNPEGLKEIVIDESFIQELENLF